MPTNNIIVLSDKNANVNSNGLLVLDEKGFYYVNKSLLFVDLNLDGKVQCERAKLEHFSKLVDYMAQLENVR
jgi:hypothetical protein